MCHLHCSLPIVHIVQEFMPHLDASAHPRICLFTDHSTSAWYFCPPLAVHFLSSALFGCCWHSPVGIHTPFGMLLCTITVLLPTFPQICLFTDHSTSTWHFCPWLHFLQKTLIWTLHTNTCSWHNWNWVLFGSGELGLNLSKTWPFVDFSLNMVLLGQSSAMYALDDEIVLQVEEHNVCNMYDLPCWKNYPDLRALQLLAV